MAVRTFYSESALQAALNNLTFTGGVPHVVKKMAGFSIINLVGFGGELVVNGGFDTGLDGWQYDRSWNWIPSHAFTTDADASSLSQNVPTLLGHRYLMEFDLNITGAGEILITDLSGSDNYGGYNVPSAGLRSFEFTPVAGTGILFFSKTTCEVDNVTITEIY